MLWHGIIPNKAIAVCLVLMCKAPLQKKPRGECPKPSARKDPEREGNHSTENPDPGLAARNRRDHCPQTGADLSRSAVMCWSGKVVCSPAPGIPQRGRSATLVISRPTAAASVFSIHHTLPVTCGARLASIFNDAAGGAFNHIACPAHCIHVEFIGVSRR